jgi:ATP synthase protein I
VTQSPNDHRPDGPTLIAIAYGWAARIMTVALEMVVPGLIGVWLDSRLGTKIVFVLLGFGGGCTLAVWHLIRMTAPQPDREQNNKTGKT